MVRFARAVKESEAKERERVRQEQERKRDEAERRRRAAEHAQAVAAAKSTLDRAIAAAKQARASGTGIVEADETWKQAKARLIELETGEAPGWFAKPERAEPPVDAVDALDAGESDESE